MLEIETEVDKTKIEAASHEEGEVAEEVLDCKKEWALAVCVWM